MAVARHRRGSRVVTGVLHIPLWLAAAACSPAIAEPIGAAAPVATTAVTPAAEVPASIVAPPSAVPVVAPAPVATPAAIDDDAPPSCPARVDALAVGEHVGDRRLLGARVLVVEKAARRLMLYRRGELALCERVALGFAPTGHKQRQGDGRTPEGWYRTSDKPWSSFHNAIAIHYPNGADARAGLAAGTISRRQHDAIVAADRAGKLPPQSTGLGGAVLIHGGGSSSDWTLGCVALEDEDLVDLRAALAGRMRADLLVLP